MNTPSNLQYTADHEWIAIDGDVATVGITDFAQAELGDIVFVDLPSVGATFSAGDVFGTIEAVKTVSDLFLPIAGSILEVNTALDDASLVNSDPYNDGWLVKIKLAAVGATHEGLMSADAYNTLTGA